MHMHLPHALGEKPLSADYRQTHAVGVEKRTPIDWAFKLFYTRQREACWSRVFCLLLWQRNFIQIVRDMTMFVKHETFFVTTLPSVI